jgi:hypothetical protein
LRYRFSKIPPQLDYALACATFTRHFVRLPQLTLHAFGRWAGASIHEHCAGCRCRFQNGAESGKFRHDAKLSGIMLLALR